MFVLNCAILTRALAFLLTIRKGVVYSLGVTTLYLIVFLLYGFLYARQRLFMFVLILLKQNW
jgi:hypothetical protein